MKVRAGANSWGKSDCGTPASDTTVKVAPKPLTFTHLHASVVVMGSIKQPLDHEPAAVEYARRQAGLSKSALARKLNVSLSLISMIESGHRNATPDLLRRLADALNCPPVVLERKRNEPAREQLDA